MINWGRTDKLSRMVAERDGLLILREARIGSLEATISDLEKMLRERETTIREREGEAETEIARREATVREREERIAWLEGQVRRLETPRLPPRTDDLQTRLKDMVARLPGWCPEQKARWMVHHIIGNGCKTAVELGVYAGRSVFPIALAIAANHGRAVYAVDAWENAVAISAPTNEQDHVWWDNVDLVAIKSSFLREMISQNLVGLIRILELPSAEACTAISQQLGQTIDFLHIDGGHSETQAIFDVTHWSQLVAAGGTIVLDDIDWPGVGGADAFLASRFERIEELRGDKFAFAAFRVP
jgi:predicted O-methyltransferase YrrM